MEKTSVCGMAFTAL
uniref:Uncharacterized protein n=1 Tax=Anopheles quadriannulatus TaxID=34691 RepID=A0A182XTH6_ANOQN